MCMYEQIEFSCGHTQLGQLTQRCDRAFDDPSGCHIRTWRQTCSEDDVGYKCEICRYIDTRDVPPTVTDPPSLAKDEDPSPKEELGDEAQASKKVEAKSLPFEPIFAEEVEQRNQGIKERMKEIGQMKEKRRMREDMQRRKSDIWFRQEEGGLIFPDLDSNQLTNSVSEIIRGYGLQPGSARPSSPIQADSEISEGYPDLNPDRRFLEPQKYFSELQSIEAAVVERSALYLFEGHHKAYYHSLSPSTQNRDFRIQIEGIRSRGAHWDSLDKSVKEVSDMLNDQKTSTLVPACTLSVLLPGEAQYLLLHLCECRNLLVRVVHNLKFLQKEKLVTTNFSVLTSGPARPEVVELVELNPEQVFQVAEGFSRALAFLVSICIGNYTSVYVCVDFLDSELLRFRKLLLGQLDLWSSLTTEERCRPETAVAIWRTISHSLDLAVVSYSGAHIESFDQRYLGHKLQSLEIYSIFFKDLGPGPTLQRRTLNCLDGFLEGEQVWVLHTHGPPPESSASQPLYLRTTIEAFADVWGPIWKTNPTNQPKMITRFNAGLGFIVPWSRSVETEPAPLSDEINCHWTAEEDAISSTDTSIPDIPYQNYLIGGAAPSITTNADCPLSAESKTYHMRCKGYLRPFGTRESSKYRDSETIQVQISSFGIATGYQRQYKRRSGVTWKAQLVEAWKMEPDRRTPEVLETRSGLEVSACSSNARRRRLIRVLNSDTMRNYLGNCHFEWSDGKCERAYFDALGSDNPEAFYDLYRGHKEWRKDLGRAVSWCLEKLLNTGVGGDGSLVSFRCVGPRQEWTAVLDPVEHTWIAFVADTPEKGTFAVSSETCLEFRFPSGLCCRRLGQKGYTVLETALEVNPDAERPENLSQCPRRETNGVDTPFRWSVSRLEKGDLLPVSTDGYLRVERPLAQAQLLVSWKPRSPWKFKESRDTLNQRVLKKPPSLCHWELLYRPSFPIKPIPIDIISKNLIDHARQTTSIAGTKHKLDSLSTLRPEAEGRRHGREQLILPADRSWESNNPERHSQSRSTSTLPSSSRLGFST